jgi:hypothetical protein
MSSVDLRWLAACLSWVCVGSCDAAVDEIDCAREGLSPCEVKACRACVETGGAHFWILESAPPQYACADREGLPIEGWFGHDHCRPPTCEEVVTVLGSFDEITPAGVSAAEALGSAEGEHVRPLEWLVGERFGGVEIDRHGTTELTLEVELEGTPRFIERQEVVHETDGVPDIIGGIDCQPSIEVDIILRLQTEDGGLDELLSATLVHRLPTSDPVLDAPFDGPTVWASVPSLNGSMSIVSVDEGYFVEEGFTLHVTFGEQGLTGALLGSLRYQPAGAGIIGFFEITYASW